MFDENNKPTNAISPSNIRKNEHKENNIKTWNANKQITQNQWKREALKSTEIKKKKERLATVSIQSN